MPEPLIPVAGIQGAWSSEALSACLREAGAKSFVFPLDECTHDLDAGKVFWEDVDVTLTNGVAVKKVGDLTFSDLGSRLQYLHQIQQSGSVVMSTPSAIDAVLDRYNMSAVMSRAGVPMPRTLVTESVDDADEVIERWGKVVAKPLFTSKGRGMTLLTPENATRLTLRTWKTHNMGPFYLQEFVEGPGRDVGIVVLGGKPLGAYSRVAAEGQWQTTTRTGGHYEPADMNDDQAEIAVKAVDSFGLDFSTVDMVETDAGWLVYEISAFGGFSGLQRATGINAARLFAEYIYHKVTYGRS